jgi:hypothetical protein
MKVIVKIVQLCQGSDKLYLATGTAGGQQANVVLQDKGKYLVLTAPKIKEKTVIAGKQRVIAWDGNVAIEAEPKVGETYTFDGVNALVRQDRPKGDSIAEALEKSNAQNQQLADLVAKQSQVIEEIQAKANPSKKRAQAVEEKELTNETEE